MLLLDGGRGQMPSPAIQRLFLIIELFNIRCTEYECIAKQNLLVFNCSFTESFGCHRCRVSSDFARSELIARHYREISEIHAVPEDTRFPGICLPYL